MILTKEKLHRFAKTSRLVVSRSMAQVLIRMDCWLNSAQNDWLKVYVREKKLKESQLIRLVIDMFLDGISSETIIVSRSELTDNLVRGVIRVTESQYRSLGLLARDHAVTTQALIRQATQYYINRLQGMDITNRAPATSQKMMNIVAANPTVPGGQKLRGFTSQKKIKFRTSEVAKISIEEELENLERQKEIRDNQLDQFCERVREIISPIPQPSSMAEQSKMRELDEDFIPKLMTILAGSENENAIELRKSLEKMLDKL